MLVAGCNELGELRAPTCLLVFFQLLSTGGWPSSCQPQCRVEEKTKCTYCKRIPSCWYRSIHPIQYTQTCGKQGDILGLPSVKNLAGHTNLGTHIGILHDCIEYYLNSQIKVLRLLAAPKKLGKTVPGKCASCSGRLLYTVLSL